MENSVYVHNNYRQQGIGKALMCVLIDKAKECNLYAISAWIDSCNKKSIVMHKQFGFYIAGELKNVGQKFDMMRSVTIMQLDLKDKE